MKRCEGVKELNTTIVITLSALLYFRSTNYNTSKEEKMLLSAQPYHIAPNKNQKKTEKPKQKEKFKNKPHPIKPETSLELGVCACVWSCWQWDNGTIGQ